MILSTVEMHTGGEPTRIVVDGWPAFAGKTLLDKRREARERFDHLRRGLMLEPLARWAVESGRVARTGLETAVRLQCPCGLVVAHVAADGGVRYDSVPSFAYALDCVAPTSTWGPVTVDIAYGGAFYAFLPADSIGLDLRTSPLGAIADAGEEIARAAAKAIAIEHADEPDLAFLYGTILTDGGNGAAGTPSRNVCIFAGRQIDRSPTGSGVAARLALQLARRTSRLGEERQFESCTGAIFTGRAVRNAPPVGRRRAVIVEVGGKAHWTGEARFRFDSDDPLCEGFSL
jgi:proline racemase